MTNVTPISAVSNTPPQVITMADVRDKQLFICPGIGVLRKTGNCTGHSNKTNKTHVIYPNETVSLLAKKRG